MSLDSQTLIANRYLVSKKVGTGGHAFVYFGIDQDQQLPVAIKTLQLPEYLKPQERNELILRFKQEAEISQKLKHPHIVTVYDQFLYQEQYFMISEFVDGFALDHYLLYKQPTIKQVIDLLVQCAKALTYAHHHQTIHRDIKPQNIMVNSLEQAKLMDFGIAKAQNNQNTSDGSLLGTLAYMSPEQLQNSRNASPLTDIYSFGVMMYEIFTASLPFPCDNLPEFITAVFTQQPPMIHEKIPQLPVELSAVVAQAMVKEPDLRYQTMEALCSDLSRCLTMIPHSVLSIALHEILPLPSINRSMTSINRLSNKLEDLLPLAVQQNKPSQNTTPKLMSKSAKKKNDPFYFKYLDQSVTSVLADQGDEDEDDWFVS